MATHIGEVPVNGHNKHEESAVLMTGSDGQAPVLDDSVIVDDDGGLPLISAVYSLATDGKSEESAFSGTNNIRVLNSSSTTNSLQIIDFAKSVALNPSSVVKTGGIQTNAFQGNETLSPQNIGNSTSVNKTPNETNCSSESTVTLESHGRKTSLQMNKALAGTKCASNVHSQGNMSHLVNLVNSVSKVEPRQAIPPLMSTTAVTNKSPPSITLSKVSVATKTVSAVPKPPVSHLPRQIAMKQPVTTMAASKQTSIVLNLKPGEPIPKVINLLGSDGKSVVVLTLSDGGKQLPTPTGAPHTGGKILIPIPSNISSSAPKPPKVALVNKVYPIAPLPIKTTIAPSQISATPMIVSVSGSSQRPPAVSTVVCSTMSSISASVSNSSESCVSVVSPSASSIELGSTIGSSPVTLTTPKNVTPLEPKPSSSMIDQSTGVSPQEARIQRLKELIKRQEDAVNKLREKRRLEIERIRDPSVISELDDDADTGEPLKRERVPLAEQKRPSSPFAVPLPPKKRIKEYESRLKTNVAKPTDSSVTPSEGAFIPNADDKAFVQLVGLENVVKSIK